MRTPVFKTGAIAVLPTLPVYLNIAGFETYSRKYAEVLKLGR